MVFVEVICTNIPKPVGIINNKESRNTREREKRISPTPKSPEAMAMILPGPARFFVKRGKRFLSVLLFPSLP